MQKDTFPAPALLFGLISLFLLNANPASGQAERCATERINEHYRRLFPKNEADTGIPQSPPTVQRSVVTIPVVVHVVYYFPVENISKEQIESQFDVLNVDFRKLNSNFSQTPAEFKSLAADCQIEFCLATRDPSGATTDGITRTKTTTQLIGSQVSPNGTLPIKHEAYGGADAWDESRYLNIWIGGLESGLFGFATFPSTAPPGEDGVVIDPRYFGTKGIAAGSAPNNLGRTATHEIGHYFNLKHVWGGSTASCTDDDDVADTPQSKEATYGCPVHPQYSCGNKDMFMNYMDYTDDGCMTMFTAGQRDRMLAALNGPRASLLTSNGCGLVDTQSTENKRVLLYPNPAGEAVFLENVPETGGDLVVHNALGQRLECAITRSAGLVELDISSLSTGLYVVGNGAFKKTFVKWR